MNKCKVCLKETKNKVYCSTKCQHKGYRGEKVDRVVVNCLFCKNDFESLPKRIEIGKSKYCSRVCKDTHQKEIYKKEGNPIYGTEHSEEWKIWNSERMVELWKTEEHKNKVKEGRDRFFEENGYYPGADELSKQKRLETNLKRYGVDNILRLPETKIKRDRTCMERYGKTSLQIMLDGLRGCKKTNIEKKISNLLIENNIKFETQFVVYYDEKKYKIYDFYLKYHNLLIESDGVYWHAKPEKYSGVTLTETQIKNVGNDIFKNELAEKNGYNLVRFWGDDIKKKNFKYKLFNTLKKYGKENKN